MKIRKKNIKEIKKTIASIARDNRSAKKNQHRKKSNLARAATPHPTARSRHNRNATDNRTKKNPEERSAKPQNRRLIRTSRRSCFRSAAACKHTPSTNAKKSVLGPQIGIAQTKSPPLRGKGAKSRTRTRPSNNRTKTNSQKKIIIEPTQTEEKSKNLASRNTERGRRERILFFA
jgi:hypothetical protein